MKDQTKYKAGRRIKLRGVRYEPGDMVPIPENFKPLKHCVENGTLIPVFKKKEIKAKKEDPRDNVCRFCGLECKNPRGRGMHEKRMHPESIVVRDGPVSAADRDRS